MNRIESEKDYQAELLGILRDQNGYTIRKATDFDRRFAIDREMLFGFLNDTQPETMEKLRKIHMTGSKIPLFRSSMRRYEEKGQPA